MAETSSGQRTNVMLRNTNQFYDFTRLSITWSCNLHFINVFMGDIAIEINNVLNNILMIPHDVFGCEGLSSVKLKPLFIYMQVYIIHS